MTLTFRNYRFELDCENKTAKVFSLNAKVGLVAEIDYNDKEDENGWSYRTTNSQCRVLPTYLYWPMKNLAKIMVQ
jgi:hypothetical protein